MNNLLWWTLIINDLEILREVRDKMKLIITNKIDEKEISKINKINDELIVYDKNSGLVIVNKNNRTKKLDFSK